MITTIDEFVSDWRKVWSTTLRHLETLTDASLEQRVAEGHRTLGRVAWHIAQTIPEMMNRTGLEVVGPAEDAPVPGTAREIAEAYREASRSLLEQVGSRWTDESLEAQDEMYGRQWKRSETLSALLGHEIHHRGQMTVLMRQAGLRVPDSFGPAREDWAQMGMEPPAV
ncbi:MAG: DinB family protein [Planctomycetota bacterium]